MAPARKRLKQHLEADSDPEVDSDQADEGSFSGSESEQESEPESASDQSDQEDDEGEESGSEDEEDEDESENEQTKAQKDADMEELEEEYLKIRNEGQDLLKNLKSHKDEDALKGRAVKNQKAIWDKSLELRFLLQKSFSNSNKLPQEPVRSSFCNTDETVAQAYSELISSSEQTLGCMLELQKALIEKNPAIVEGTGGNKNGASKDDALSNDLNEKDEHWLQIHRTNDRIKAFRNNSVDKWQRKAQVTTGAAALKGKLQALNQNISDQVTGFMRDPNRMVKRMQLKRSSVGIFGNISGDSKNIDSGSVKEQGEDPEGDPELLDDSEFYQQLLKEFLETCNFTSSEETFYALKRMQPKKRKIVDRRASKSRKIRYNVHEKLVNFMAPIPMELPDFAPKLFESLFGNGNQRNTATQ